METITLKPRKEESILRHHPWVFSGAIASIPDSVEEGNLVKVVSADGKTLGYGHYQIGSIAVRLLTFGDNPLADYFFRTRLESACRLWKTLGLMRQDNNCFRLVHGEGDFLPGLVIDVYGDTAVVQAHSPGMHF